MFNEKTKAWLRFAAYVLTTSLLGLLDAGLVTDPGWTQALTLVSTGVTALAAAALGKQLVRKELKGVE